MTLGGIAIFLLFVYLTIVGPFKPWITYAGYCFWIAVCPTWNWRWAGLPDLAYQNWLIASLLLGVLFNGYKHSLSNRSLQALLAFNVLIFLSNSLSTGDIPRNAIFFDVIWKISVVVYAGQLVLDSHKKVLASIYAFLAGTAWTSWNLNELYLINGWISIHGFSWHYLDSNTFSNSLAAPAIVGFAFFMLSKDIKLRVLGFLTCALASHAILILQSRGCYLGLAAGIFACVLLIRQVRAKRTPLILFALVAIIATGESVRKEFSTIFVAAEERDSSAAGRPDLWRAGFELTRDHPLTGVGLGSVTTELPKYYHREGSMTHKASHNLAVDVAGGAGIPALITYLTFFFASPLGLFRERKTIGMSNDCSNSDVLKLSLLPATVGYWIASMFSSGLLIEVPYVLVTLGIATSRLIPELTKPIILTKTAHSNQILEASDELDFVT